MLTLRRLVRVGRSLAVLYSRVGVLRAPVTNTFIFFYHFNMFFFSALAIVTITMHLLVYNGRFTGLHTILKCSHRHHTSQENFSSRNNSKCLLALLWMKTPRSLPNIWWVLDASPGSSPCKACSTSRAGAWGRVLGNHIRRRSRSDHLAGELLHRSFCTVPNHIPLWEKN